MDDEIVAWVEANVSQAEWDVAGYIRQLRSRVAELEATAQNLNNLLVMVKTCFPDDFATLSQAIDEVHAESVTNQASRTLTEE